MRGLWLVLAVFLFSTQAGLSAGPSLEQMAGQMILVGFAGDTVEDTTKIAALIGQGTVGGVMYLRTNVKSLGEVKAMNRAFAAAGAPLPPFIALDQEGGRVERLTKAVGFAETPSAATMAKTKPPAEAERIYARMAEGLAKLGFDLNFAPVVDLNLNPNNPIIAKYGRSFGADPKTVFAYADAVVAAHRKAHVLTVLKHFPGHGSSTGDTHEGFVDITKTWRIEELDPFAALIAKGDADMVMVAHLYHAKFDTDPTAKVPASLSPSWIEGVLRQKLGYQGVVITDDLQMGAIRDQFSLDQTVRRAVMAGADILLFSNTYKPHLSLARDVQDILVRDAKADPAFRARIVESYNRIAALKKRL